MERLLVQYAAVIWTLLNLLYYYLNFLNIRLCKSLADFDPKFEIKCDKKSFFKFLIWIVFGIIFLSADRQAVLQKRVTTDEHLVLIGGFIFLMVGYLLKDILYLGKYFVYRREIPKTTLSFKSSAILSSFEFFGYSALMLLSFLISKHPLLLGGTIGLATGGLICICKILGKQRHGRNNQIT